MKNRKFFWTSIIIVFLLIFDSISYAGSNMRRDPFGPQVRRQRNDRRIILDKTYFIRPNKQGYHGDAYEIIDEDSYRGFDILVHFDMNYDNQLAIWVCSSFRLGIVTNGSTRWVTPNRISDVEFQEDKIFNGSFLFQDREYSISLRYLNARYIKGRFFDSFRIRIIIRRA